MAKRKKIIVAGSLVLESVYPAVNSRDRTGVRTGKHKISSEAQRRMNAIYSYQKLELLLAANFTEGDLVCTLTYDDRHLPESRKAAEGKLKYFRQKLSAARKRRGETLIMFWNSEHRHGDGRWHHHCVINSTGNDYTEILNLWGQGEVEFTLLRVDREENYATLARYMAKEERERVGQRSWSYTRNARKPEVETYLVPNDEKLKPPRTAIVFEDTGDVQTEYGHYRFIKYLCASSSVARRRARRRRR
jgi:hypothetical protein|nr:MAG TPA_asm: replication protein A [Caudoviricetes sp.]